MPERNVELMQRVWQDLTDHPDKRDQTSWGHRPLRITSGPEAVNSITEDNLCGTTACLCGDALLLSGYALQFAGHDSYASSFLRPDGSMGGDFQDEGATLFGLTDDEAHHLFVCTVFEDEALDLLESLIGDCRLFESSFQRCADCGGYDEDDDE